MRRLALAFVFASVAGRADAAPHPVVDRVYHCTLIARSTEFAGGFEHAPTINAYGQVAFTALRADGVYELRVGRGDAKLQGVPRSHLAARASLTQSGTRFLQAGPPTIDNGGRVAFWATRAVPPFGQDAQGLYDARFDANDVGLAPVIDSRVGDPSSDFVSFHDPLPTWPGSLLFDAQYRMNLSQHGALFRDRSIAFDYELNPFQISDYATDPGGTSAYVLHGTAGNFPNQEERLDLSGTHVFDSIALPGVFSGVSIASNALPIVSYARFTDANDWQLRVRVIDPPAIYVDSSQDAVSAAWFPGSDVPTSVNAFAEVAFTANDVAQGGRRIFVADGDEIQRVVCDNDVRTGFMGARAINSDGQIAFLGSDGGFVSYVVRADPLNGLPTSCNALADGTPCADDDPESAAVCSAGSCVGEGVARATSCIGLDDDTPCDDGDPQTLAYCEDQLCTTASFEVPEPSASLGGVAALLGLAALSARGRCASRRRPARARRGTRADRKPARW